MGIDERSVEVFEQCRHGQFRLQRKSNHSTVLIVGKWAAAIRAETAARIPDAGRPPAYAPNLGETMTVRAPQSSAERGDRQ